MANTLTGVPCRHSYRFGFFLFAVLSSTAGLYSAPCWAKHARSPSSIASDPCPKMADYVKRRVEQMKQLKLAMAKEQSIPNTVAGIFDLMQGKSYVDQSKSEQMAQLRREADNLNMAMRAAGCKAVDVDQEMTKAPVPTLPTAGRANAKADVTLPTRTGR